MNEQLSRLKEQYEEIKAPDSLKERSQKIMEDMKKEWKDEEVNQMQHSENNSEIRENTKNQSSEGGKSNGARKGSWRRWATVAAAAAIVFAGGLNVSESFAASVAQLPGMEGIVRVLTLDRFDFSEGGMEAKIVTPQIEGLVDQKLQDKLNQELKDKANDLIAQFETDAKELQEAFPGEDVHMGVEFNYDIKADNDDLLVLDTYIYNVVGSSSTVHKYYNIDKKSGTLLTLPELMADHPNYVSELSEYIRGEMKRQNESGENAFFTDNIDNPAEGELEFKEIAPDQLFYINSDNQLVICFDKYTVAPGSSGTPEFVIPVDYYTYQAK